MNVNHAEKACRLFSEGYNCAQSVFLAYCDVTGMDENTALKLSSSFGGGIGRMREVCGACSGMFMVAGLLYGYTGNDDDKTKAEHYKRIQLLASEFKKEHQTIICRELLKNLSVTNTPTPDKRTEEYYKVRPCVRFVRTACEVMDKYISENPVK